MTASIVGWAHTPFGKFDAETVESLVVKVANEALADAGIGAADVDEIVLGHFNAGFSPQDFTASLVLQADPALRFKPATRVENACATGSAAVHQGIRAIECGAAKVVLVVGVEQMTRTPSAEIGKNLLKACLLRHIHQPLRRHPAPAHRHRPGVVADKPFVNHAAIHADDVAKPQLALVCQAMHHFVIHRDARMTRILSIAQKRALAAVRLDPGRGVFVHLPGRHTGTDEHGDFFQHLAGDRARWPHQLQIALRLENDHLLQFLSFVLIFHLIFVFKLTPLDKDQRLRTENQNRPRIFPFLRKPS